MRLTRRTFLAMSTSMLAGAGIVPATAAVATALDSNSVDAQPIDARPIDTELVIIDSRIAESAHFAAQRLGQGAFLVDLAIMEAGQWAALRAIQSLPSLVIGLTRWSGQVIVRGILEGQGYRLHAHHRAPAPLSGHDNLYFWEMRAHGARGPI